MILVDTASMTTQPDRQVSRTLKMTPNRIRFISWLWMVGGEILVAQTGVYIEVVFILTLFRK